MATYTLTLTLAQVQAINAALSKDPNMKPFIAKDHGAYVGVTGLVYYFRGCDPHHDKDWYEECRRKFGGDDFGIRLSRESFLNVVKYANAAGVKVSISPTRIVTSVLLKKSSVQ